MRDLFTIINPLGGIMFSQHLLTAVRRSNIFVTLFAVLVTLCFASTRSVAATGKNVINGGEIERAMQLEPMVPPVAKASVVTPHSTHKAGLSGNYNIGTGGYASLGAFFADLNTNGVDGNVTATVIENISEPGGTLNALTYGTGGPFNVVITATSPVTISLGAGASITLSGVNNVTFDGGAGRNLTIRGSSDNTQPTIVLQNDARFNTIKNCYIEGGFSSNPSSGVVVFGTTTGTNGNSNNTVQGCDIRDRSDVTARPANGVTSLGSASGLNKDNTLTGNNIYNFSQYGVNVNTNSGNNWVITTNSVYCAYSATTSQIGILVLSTLSGGDNVSGNFIGGSAPNAGGTPWLSNAAASLTFLRGIQFQGANLPASNVDNNTVKNISNSGLAATLGIFGASGSGTVNGNTIGDNSTANSISLTNNINFVGIQMQYKNTDVTISNNTIANVTCSNTGTSALIRGISIADTQHTCYVSNNSIHDLQVSAASTSSNGSIVGILYAFAFGTTYSVDIDHNTIYNLRNANTASTGLVCVSGITVNALSRYNAIQRNTIYGLNSSGTSVSATAPNVVIGITTINSNNDPINVRNNMISFDGALSTTASFVGIWNRVNNGSDPMDIFNNTVKISGTGSGTNRQYGVLRGRYGVAATNRVSSYWYMRNNIFSVTRAGTGPNYAIGTFNQSGWNSTGTASTVSSDYNVLYTGTSVVALWDSVNSLDFATWQTSSGGDAHSINSAVNFVGASDLHLASTSEVAEKAGTPIPPFVTDGGSVPGLVTNEAGVANDFDGADRSKFAPDMGADEDASYPTVTAFDVTGPADNANPVAASPTLSWSASSNVVGYDVYLDQSVNPTTVVRSNLSATSALVGPLSHATTYHWKVLAKGEQGSQVFSTSTFTFTTGTPPADPSNLVFTSVQPNELDLQWDDNASNEDGYRVYRSATGQPGTYSQIGGDLGSGTTTFIDAPLALSTRYYYQVVAFSNLQGESGPASGDKSTLAVAPGTATITSPSWHSLTVVTNSGSNPAGSTELAIEISGSSFGKTSYFVHGDGSLSATPEWHLSADWGGANGVKVGAPNIQFGTNGVLGLAPSTQYSVRLKSRNTDGVEADFGSSADQSTAAAIDISATPVLEKFGNGTPLPDFPPIGWTNVDVDQDASTYAAHTGTIYGIWHQSTTNLYSAGGAARYFTYDYPDAINAPVYENPPGTPVDEPGNDYLFTMPVYLQENVRYNVTFWFRTVPGVGHNEAIVLASHPNPSSVLSTLRDDYFVTYGGYFQTGVNFAPPASGIYYIGFYDHSPTNAVTLRFEDVKIEQAPDYDLLAEKINQLDRYPNGTETKVATTSVNPHRKVNDDVENLLGNVATIHPTKKVQSGKAITHPIYGKAKVNPELLKPARITAKLKGGANSTYGDFDLNYINSNGVVTNVGQNPVTSTQYHLEWTTSGNSQTDAQGVDILAGHTGDVSLQFQPANVGTYYTVSNINLPGDGNTANNTASDWLFAFPKPAELGGNGFVIAYDSTGNSPPFRFGTGNASYYSLTFTVPEGRFLRLAGFNTYYKNTAGDNLTPVTDPVTAAIWAVDQTGAPVSGAPLFQKQLSGDNYLYNGSSFGQAFTIPLDDANMNFAPGARFALSIGFSQSSDQPMAGSDVANRVQHISYISDDGGLTWSEDETYTHFIKGLFWSLNAVYVHNSMDADGSDNTTGDRTGASGWTVNLYQGQNLVATAQTDVNGDAVFSPIDNEIPNGSYRVEIEDREGFTHVTSAQQDISLAGESKSVTFAQFENVDISGNVYLDFDGSASGGDAYPGITVQLKAAGNPVQTKVSNVDGEYVFANVGPGSYTIEATIPEGDGVSQSADPVTTSSGNDVSSEDFGLYHQSSISGVIFTDENADGVKDAGEAGLQGWTVNLDDVTAKAPHAKLAHITNAEKGRQIVHSTAKASHVTHTAKARPHFEVVEKTIRGKKVRLLQLPRSKSATVAHNAKTVATTRRHSKTGQTDVTDANGSYTFDALAPGFWEVSADLEDGYTQSYPGDPVWAVETNGEGVESEDNDFGVYELATTSGTVYLDVDGDGSQGQGEDGLEGLYVNLTGDSYQTDANGGYSATQTPGSYYAELASFPEDDEDYIITEPVDQFYAGDLISSGETLDNLNFGIYALGSISGKVFDDANHNGTQDNTELGLANWKVYLVNGGNKVDSTTSANDGSYSFGSLEAGGYEVQIAPQNGYNSTNTTFYGAIVISGTHLTAKDFGQLLDTYKFRSFKQNANLITKGVQIKGKKPKTGPITITGVPNELTILYNATNRVTAIGANPITILGLGAAKNTTNALVAIKKADELTGMWTKNKAYSAHTGKAYPLDSTRFDKNGVKLKKIGAIKAGQDVKVESYNNVGWAEAILLRLNIIASDTNVTPKGFGELQIDSTISLWGYGNQKGVTLREVSKRLDTLNALYASKGLVTDSGYNVMTNFAYFIGRVNSGFYAAMATGNYAYDSANTTGKNKYAAKALGVATAATTGILKHIPDAKAGEPFTASTDYAAMPTQFSLGQNYPNPFNPSTTITVDVPAELDGAIATLKVYNVLGQEVATIFQNQELSSGVNEITFDASKLSSGVYFYRIATDDGVYSDMKKMMLLK